MAARRETIEPESAPSQSYDLGLGLDDISLPRLRIVGRQAKLVELEVAKPGDIAIGQGADDEDSTIVFERGGDKGVRVYVLKIHANYACGFDGPNGSWEEGDPEMPPDAKRQFNYTLYVPSYDDTLPVLYTASGGAAGVARRGLNTALGTHCISGHVTDLCFELTSKMNPHTKGAYPGPVWKLAQPDADEVKAARAMHDSVVGPERRALESGEEPGF